MRGPGHNGHYAAIVDIFATSQLDRGVVDGVELEAEQVHGHLASHAPRQVVDQQSDVHIEGRLNLGILKREKNQNAVGGIFGLSLLMSLTFKRQQW